MRSPHDEPVLPFEDLKRRTSDLYGVVRWWAIGPQTRLLFWSSLVLVMILGLVGYAITHGRNPVVANTSVAPKRPMLHCIWRYLYRLDAHQKWQRVRWLPERALGRTRALHTVVVFNDNSTFRLTRGTRFNWYQLPGGHVSFTLQRGGGWFQLSPLDDVEVKFPDGVVTAQQGAVFEVHVHRRPRKPTSVHVRSGEVTVAARLARRRLATAPKAKFGIRRKFRFYKKTVPMKDGQMIWVGVSTITTAKEIPADNTWQQWNLKWKNPSDLANIPEPKYTPKPRASRTRRPRRAE